MTARKPMCRAHLKQKKHVAKKPMTKRKKKETLEAKWDNGKGKRKESGLEKKVREFLTSAGFYFKQEYYLKNDKHARAYDFAVFGVANNFILIEVHGNRYHFTDDGESPCPRRLMKSFRNDTLKIQMAKEQGIPLLIIWEDQIKSDFQLIKKTITEKIKMIS